MRQGRYLVHEPHFGKRCRERSLNVDDVRNAIEHARSCTPYAGREPTEGGSNWRVSGPSIDGDLIAVGVEACEVSADRFVLLITLFEV